MHRARVMIASAGASIALATSSFVACSSDNRPAAARDPVEAGIPEASTPEESGSLGPPAGYDGGVGLGLADVADTPCAARGGPVAVVLPAADASPAPPFRQLQKFGDKRVADAVDGAGFVLFGADGAGAKLVLTTPIAGAAAALGSQIVFGGRPDFNSAVAQAYDANGGLVGERALLAEPEPVAGAACGADENAALVVWMTTNAVRARGFTAAGAAGTKAYDLGVTSNTNRPSIAVSSVQSGLFGVAFSGDDGGGKYQTAFGRGSSTARIGDPSNLFTGAVPRTVAGLVRTPSGFALLVTVHDGANPYAMLVLTDAGGRRTSAGLKLVGAGEGSALAVKGTEIGVLAHRRQGDAFESKSAMEFRPFDLTGVPLGPWVCLEPPGNASLAGGGLVAEANGYAAIFRASDGSTSLARFDHLGTGSP